MDPKFTTSSSSNSDFLFEIASSSSLSLNNAGSKFQSPAKKRSKLIRTTDQTAHGRISKPKYSKKSDPSAPKITEPCTECGKTFWSWKALFGHMRCHPERQWRGINPPPNLRRRGVSSDTSPGFDLEAAMTEEDHEIAACLIMLSNGPHLINHTHSNNITSCLGALEPDTSFVLDGDDVGPTCRFECLSCKKVFGSHQALGGHRASHKNVKGCFAITRSDDDGDGDWDTEHGDHERDTYVEGSSVMVLGSMHKCSICMRVFSSGQALGGHKRCHWERGDEPQAINQGAIVPFHGEKGSCGDLDLNMPAPVEDNHHSSFYSSSSFTLDLRLGL